MLLAFSPSRSGRLIKGHQRLVGLNCSGGSSQHVSNRCTALLQQRNQGGLAEQRDPQALLLQRNRQAHELKGVAKALLGYQDQVIARAWVAWACPNAAPPVLRNSDGRVCRDSSVVLRRASSLHRIDPPAADLGSDSSGSQPTGSGVGAGPADRRGSQHQCAVADVGRCQG